MTNIEPLYINGFYHQENDGERNFRWMKKGKSEIALSTKYKGWIRFFIGSPYSEKQLISVGSQYEVREFEISPGWNEYFFYLSQETSHIIFEGKCLFPVSGDDRELSLMLGEPKFGLPSYDTGIVELKGFYATENDGLYDFRWMGADAELLITQAGGGRWLLIDIKSPSAWPEKFYFSNPETGINHEIHILPGE